MFLICIVILWVSAAVNTIKQRKVIKSMDRKELMKKVVYPWIAAVCLTIVYMLQYG